MAQAVKKEIDVLILMIILALHGISMPAALVVSVITACCAAFAELISRHGNDTVTVQVTAAVVLYLLQHMFL